MNNAALPATPLLSPQVVWLLCAMSMLPAFSTDIMLPATVLIAEEFEVPGQLGGLLIGGFLLGYGLGQVFWGVASDAFGRRPVILASLGAMTFAAAGCIVAPNFWVLLALRFVHGLCAGAPVVGRAMTRDLGTGPQMVQLLALLMAMISIGPLLAPVIGSALIVFFDWRANFIVLTVIGIVCFVSAVRILPETLKARRPERLSLSFVLRAGRTLLSARDYIIGGGVSVLTFAGYGSVLALGPAVMGVVYGVTPQVFGLLFFLAAASNGLGSLLVRWAGARVPIDRIMTVGIAALAATVLLEGAFLFFVPPLWAFWLSVCLYMISLGIVMPSGMAIALRPAGGMPGFAASFLGMLIMVGAFVGGALATVIYDGSHVAISLVAGILGGLAVILYALGRTGSR